MRSAVANGESILRARIVIPAGQMTVIASLNDLLDQAILNHSVVAAE